LKYQETRSDTYKQAGLLLIKSTEAGLHIRNELISGYPNCLACNKADDELLKTLKEIKIIFLNGTA